MSPGRAYAIAGQTPPEELVERYAPLVKKIGNYLLGRLPEGVELQDLVQTGLIALLDAARQYTPSRGASFDTYASIRIRGAMLDEFRNTDWAPRSVYRKQRQLTAAVRAVENRTGQPAGAREIAAELGVSLDEYFRMVTTTATQRMRSLDDTDAGDTGEDDDTREPDNEPSTALESEEFRSELAAAIRELPQREALVMSLYYDEELNLKEIGATLGVSESRVCQIHGQALTRLRARLGQWHDAASGR